MVKKGKIKILKSKAGKRKTLKKKLTVQGAVLHKRPLLARMPRTKIKVVGIGGGGSSIVAELAGTLKGIEFVALNTDRQALNVLPAKIKKVQMGLSLTKGLGAGMDARVGEEAAKETEDDFKKVLERVDFCILVACLGGGTGSGAAPVFAAVSKELGNVNFGIFTLPFSFEGEKRAKIAKSALERLKQHLDGFAVVSNERVFQIIDKETALQTAFSAVNKILAAGLKGLVETVYRPGLINIDFADLKTILDFNPAAAGRNRPRLLYLHSVEIDSHTIAQDAVREALVNPLQDYGIEGADRILFNIAGPNDLKMTEVEKVSTAISSINKNTRIIFGISRQPKLKNKLCLTVLATKTEEKKMRKDKTKKLKKQRAEKLNVHSAVRIKIAPGKAKKQVKMPAVHGSSYEKKKKENKKAGKDIAERKKRPAEEKNLLLDKTSEEHSLGKPAYKAPQEENRQDEQFPKENLSEARKIRRNGLELQKAAEEIEKEIIRQEELWETPAFIRKQKVNNQATNSRQ